MLTRPRYDRESLATRANGRVSELPRRLDVAPDNIRNTRVLELGCGNGECTAAVIELLDADAIGIDPFPRWEGGPYASLGATGRLLQADACSPEDMRGLGQFNFAHSYTVFEHIDRPLKALHNLYHALKPGGRAFLSFNLYLGASASHLAGYLPDMPWIHLTHTDAEARAIMKERHGKDRGFSWVNKWTSQDYLDACEVIGFNILAVWYMRKYPDEDFYAKHIDTLGMYPKDELSKNFMNMRIERPIGSA